MEQKCLNCSRLGSCLVANGKIKKCSGFIKFSVSTKDLSKLLDCSYNVALELRRSPDGVRAILHKMHSEGIDMRIAEGGITERKLSASERNTHKASYVKFYRKDAALAPQLLTIN